MSCKYCNGSKEAIRTEIDNEAYFTIVIDDPEYPSGYLIDIYKNDDTDMLYSFFVPQCPMCGGKPNV